MQVDRRRRMVVAGSVVGVMLVAGFLWFRPDALFTDRTVDEELDQGIAAALAASPMPSAAPSPAASPPSSSPSASRPVDIASGPGPSPADDADSGPESPPASRPSVDRDEERDTGSETDQEPEPAEPEPVEPQVVARGDWTSLEHDTTGSVAIVDDGGDLELALADLDTSNGPDLHVILSPKEGASGDWYGYADGAVELGALKGNRGTQVYDLPDDIDLADVASVVIWCERFSVGFGVANLG